MDASRIDARRRTRRTTAGRAVAGVVVAGALVAALAACGDDEAAAPPTELPGVQLAGSLEPFDSCDELRAWARDELAPRVGAYGFGGGGYDVVEDGSATRADAEAQVESGEMGFDTADESSAAGAGDSAAPAPVPGDVDADAPDHSETNVQVEGVDEPDLVKTDGDRILAVADGKLHLVSAERGELLDSVELPDGSYDGEMMLVGDRVLLFSSDWYAVPLEGDAPADSAMLPELQSVQVVQADIDGDRLSVSDAYELDGSYLSARLTGDVVRLVVQAEPQQRLPFVSPATPSPQGEQRAAELNQQVVEEAEAEDFLPRWRQLGSDDEVVEEGDLVSCEQAHAPETFSGFGMVVVVSIDVSEGLGSGIVSANGAGVMATGYTVYSSSENLYVAAPEWVDWEGMSDDELREAEQSHGTDIHRFDISDPAQATYEMSGHVDGSLLNQFAMDEHDGRLRVATTTGAPWVEGDGESESHVVVLEPRDGALTQIGSVSGLGPGETIYAVRFMGDVGYVVTFEQTDPLYTIDLSNPAEPRMAGELEMPGYSAYLHPVGDGKLIGIGQDATEDGVTQGVLVSLFDVSDPANPERVAHTTVPDAWSGAEGEHRAFLWWAETNLLALPVELWTESESFTGLIGFTVDVDGATIEELGRVSHPARTVDYEDEPYLPVEPEPGDDVIIDEAPPIDVEESYVDPIQRSLVIGDQLWTFSQAGLLASDLVTLEPGPFVDLTP